MVEDSSADGFAAACEYIGSIEEEVPGSRERTGISGMRSRNEGRPRDSEGNSSLMDEVFRFRLVRRSLCRRRAYRTRAAAMTSMSTNPPMAEQITATNVRFDVKGLGCGLDDGTSWLKDPDVLVIGRTAVRTESVPVSVLVNSEGLSEP